MRIGSITDDPFPVKPFIFRRLGHEGLDFIGCFDRQAEDLRRLGVLLGLPLDEGLLSLHVNRTLPPGAEGEREALKADRLTIDRLTDLLVEDIRFYQRYAQ